MLKIGLPLFVVNKNNSYYRKGYLIMKNLDCRGLPCPQPVILCRAAAEDGVQQMEVLVDNEPAVENVRRFLAAGGTLLRASREKKAVGGSRRALKTRAPPSRSQGARQCPDKAGELKTLVLITTETIGRGDESLGSKLMGNFLTTLPELGPRLWRLILINGGVKLATKPGPALEALRGLEQNGVGVLVCGTCLAHYGLSADKAVGETSNMLDIVTSLDLADKIIRP